MSAASWQESDHRAALMRLAAEAPHLTPLCIEVAHQHDCLEEMKEQINEMPRIIRESIREESFTSSEARWRTVRGWLTTIAAVVAGAGSIYEVIHK